MPADNTPTLDQELRRIDAEIEALRAEARDLLANAPVVTDVVPYVYPPERYVLTRADGMRYWNTPGVNNLYSGFQQKPAALRLAATLPGCRVYDSKTRTYITE